MDKRPDLVNELRALRSRIAEAERPKRVACVLRNGSVSLPVGEGHNVSFSTVDVDTGGMFDPAEPDRITAPRSGVYVVTGSATIDAMGDTTGLRSLELVAGGAQIGFTLAPLPNNGWRASPSGVVVLERGDVVRLWAFQDNGDDDTLGCSSGRLSVALVAPIPEGG